MDGLRDGFAIGDTRGEAIADVYHDIWNSRAQTANPLSRSAAKLDEVSYWWSL